MSVSQNTKSTRNISSFHVDMGGECVWGAVHMVTIYTRIKDEFWSPKKKPKTEGSSYMQLQNCSQVNGIKFMIWEKSLRGRLICEMDLKASIYSTSSPGTCMIHVFLATPLQSSGLIYRLVINLDLHAVRFY